MSVEKIKKLKSERTPEEVLKTHDFLPVAKLRAEIKEKLSSHPNFVLVAETGSGKTTCLPLILLELKHELRLAGGIAVTEPRRITTTSVAERVASMVGEKAGETIGHHVRFQENTSPQTEITYMTDGILLRKAQYDPLLEEYSIVMVDEAHERSLNIDLCLGLLKEINQRRQKVKMAPIRIIVTSATIEENKFVSFIGGEDRDNYMFVPGKMYPVSINYLDQIPERYEISNIIADRVELYISNNIKGNILVFLPGKGEIASAMRTISARNLSEQVDLIPLHSELSIEAQNQIFSESSIRKVILATNIAETGITVPNRLHVIDTGKIKQTFYNPKTGIEKLELIDHSQSGIIQRAGRAGRTEDGTCDRLFPESTIRTRRKHQVPEIQRSDLSQVVLIMKKAGVRDVFKFDYIDRPDYSYLKEAVTTLTDLGALDQSGELTEIGETLADLSLKPKIGCMVIEAMKSDIQSLNEVTVIASLLDGKNVFVSPSTPQEILEAENAHQEFMANDNDFDVLLDIYSQYADSGYSAEWALKHYLNEKALDEALGVRLELIQKLRDYGLFFNSSAPLRPVNAVLGRIIYAGFKNNLIRCLKNGHYLRVSNTKDRVSFSSHSVYRFNPPPKDSLIISGEIFQTPSDTLMAGTNLLISKDWVKEEKEDYRHSRRKGAKSRHHR